MTRFHPRPDCVPAAAKRNYLLILRTGGVMYRNVMVPVDGSSFSREAVLQGLRIASQNGATLRLVRVASAPVLFSAPETMTLSSDAAKQLRASELASLYAMAAECRAHST